MRVLVILIVLFFISCNSSEKTKIAGVYIDSNVNSKLILKKNRTYQFFKEGLHMVDTKDTLKNNGKWEIKNGYIILNSFKQPTEYGVVQIEEYVDEQIEDDSITFEFSSGMKLPVYADTVDKHLPIGSLESIEINNDGKLHWVSQQKKLRVKKINIDNIIVHGIITDYPIYRVVNNNANQFKIHENPDMLPVGSPLFKMYEYFTDEPVRISKDSLIINDYIHLKKIEGNPKHIGTHL